MRWRRWFGDAVELAFVRMKTEREGNGVLVGKRGSGEKNVKVEEDVNSWNDGRRCVSGEAAEKASVKKDVADSAGVAEREKIWTRRRGSV